MGSVHQDRFLMRVIAMKGAECPTPPIRWLVDKPVWENQWPLPQDKLVALHDLVQEQLDQGHLEPSTSPWNTPVFRFKKKPGKWRLLQDLRKVNAMMESMGTLQAVCAAVGEAIILHYMDDVLVCAPNDELLSHALDLTIHSLVAAGFELQEEKIQRMPPWKYLGLEIDSAYVAGVVSRAEQAVLSEVSNSALFNLLSKLVNLVSHREQEFYVMHIRSHTDLPGFIAKGNRRADALAVPVEMAPLPDVFGQAKISHQLFHQNAPGLVRQFHLTREQAWAIVSTCPSCQQHALPALSAGANPRRLNSCEVWQTDVTHIMSFGRQRYVHVSVDTFSGAVYASAHTGEKSGDAMKHLVQAFSFLGIPKPIKTDNGSTYTSKDFRSFLQQWGVEHKTGIPYSPTGQAIMERTHQKLKRVLSQQHQSLKLETPQIQLSKALFTLNFLNCTFENLNPPIVRHFRENCQLQLKAKPPVIVKDPATRETEGPHDLITWGCGYACMSTPSDPKKGVAEKSGDAQQSLVPVLREKEKETKQDEDANPRWEQLDHEVVKDLMKAIRDNGLGSPYFKQLLKGTFNIYDLTPFDLKSLASMILTDSQFIIWEAKWRRALNELRDKYQGGANAGFTIAQLAGDPPLDNPAHQARLFPREVLADIKNAARKAMVQIPPTGVTESSYTDIKQGPSESFTSFIDRLTQAVDRQVSDEGVKPHFIRCLAFANANPE
ncbi:hypothetical protein DUI87_03378 [Hirundo rustica rustica]|uniref:Uncharacterized protein n=1 Tax=Hirundo rustica rustica TaxID=333673 RepID=A0A3M0L3I6_HIRRU|nr:hypothetical protein DUI87_03378 [Hirundo rustica rustica]